MLETVLTVVAWWLVMPREIDANACGTTTPPPIIDQSSLLSFTNLRISCGTTTVEARMDDCAVQCLGHNSTEEIAITSPTLTNVTMSDVASGCSPSIQGNDTVFTINITDCAPTQTSNSTHSVYTYAINSYANINIQPLTQRGVDISFRFSCIYVLGVRSTLQLAAPLQSSSLSFTPVSVELAIAMALFNDSTFSVPVAGDLTLNVPSYIYVGLTFTDGNANYLVLQAVTCWATPTSDSTSARQYAIIASGCSANLSDSTSVLIFENYYSSQARFAVKAFTWSGLSLAQQFVYLHCDVAVCDTVLNDTCKSKNCVGQSESRRKRSVQSHLITVGPVRIRASGTACGLVNGGCAHMCSEDDFGYVRCSCIAGYVLHNDQKSCKLRGNEPWHVESRDEVGLSAKEEPENTASDYILFAAASIILLVSVGLLFAMFSRKTRYKRKYKGAHEL